MLYPSPLDLILSSFVGALLHGTAAFPQHNLVKKKLLTYQAIIQ